MSDVIDISGNNVHLDPKNLDFNEATLTLYLQKEGGYYNNFGGMLARAEFLLQNAELEYETLYGEKFKNYKDDGGSDKYVEGKTDCDEEVVEAKKKVIECKLKVRLLTQHLKAWDKNHENAQSFGHFLRKELDKLGTDKITKADSIYSHFDAIDDVVTHVT